MALSRWSHSEHYIYTVDEDRVQISLFGHFTSYSILNRYAVIDRRAVEEGFGLFSRLELYFYLTTWAKAKRGFLTPGQQYFRINLLRNLGHLNFYIKGYTDDMPHWEPLSRRKKNDGSNR
jgi:hypothetical protein